MEIQVTIGYYFEWLLSVVGLLLKAMAVKTYKVFLGKGTIKNPSSFYY